MPRSKRALAAALRKVGLGILALSLCLSPQMLGASAELLNLESSDERPHWTSWLSVRLPGLDLTSIVFHRDDRHGWAVGEEGTVLATTDGGLRWTEQKSRVDFDLNAIHVGNKTTHAWIVGNEGVILRTVDGGATWTRQSSQVAAHLFAVHANADGLRVWAVGAEGTIVFSSNGGDDWTQQGGGVETALVAVRAASDGGSVRAAGRNGVVVVFDKRTATWEIQENDTRHRLNSVHLSANGLRDLAVGRDGFVVSRSGGQTGWTKRSSGVYARLNAVRLSADGMSGWAVGRGGVLLSSSDGGVSWTPQASGTDFSLRAIHFSGDGVLGWAAGEGGVILATEDGGASWRVGRGGLDGRLRFNAVHLAADGRHGWVAGNDGLILASDDGGATWTPQYSGTCADFFGLYMFEDKRHGWAVGENGTVLATDDGGRTWRPQLSETNAGLNAVSIADEGSVGLAAGDCGTILATTDGGVSWTRVNTGTDVDINGLDIAGNGFRGWAVGDDGAILVTGDGGDTWTPQLSRTDRDLMAVQFAADGERGWAVGDDGVILITDNGGGQWTVGERITELNLRAIHFTGDGMRGWAVGDDGVILATDDGRVDWTVRAHGGGTVKDLHAIHMDTDGRRGWSVGRRGTVLKTDDGWRSWNSVSIGSDDDLVAVHFSNNHLFGWIVDDDGDVVVTNNGGVTWIPQPRKDLRPNAVHVTADGSRIWAAGRRGTIVEMNSSWRELTSRLSATRFQFNAIHGTTDTSRGWAVAEDGKIATTEDGGSIWSLRQMYIEEGSSSIHATVVSANGTRRDRNRDLEREFLEDLNAIHMAGDGMRGWAVGRRGNILATEDGGTTWTLRESVTSRDLTGLHVATDGRKGWAVGDCGVVLVTHDAWTSSNNMGGCLVISEFSDIHFDNDGRYGWVVGRRGTVLTTDNGGDAWTEQQVGIDFAINAITGAGAGDGFKGMIVGRSDRILVTAKPNGTPYLTSFNAITRANGNVELRFSAEDGEGDKIKVYGIEVCERLVCGNLPLEGLNRRDNSWSMVWDPTSTRSVEIDAGDELKFRVTLKDDAGEFSFTHASAGSWQYRPWYWEVWNEHRQWIWSVLAVAGVVVAYVCVLFGIFWLKPVLLVRVSEALVPGLESNSFYSRFAGALLPVLHAVVLARLVRHSRTAQAWARHYAGTDDASLAQLSLSLRTPYLTNPEVLDAWVEKRLDRGRQAVTDRNTFKSRPFYVEMPVALEIERRQTIHSSKSEIHAVVQDTLQRNRGAVAVCGPGGAGKTTLAVQVARWACAADRAERVLPHAAIPVWVETETTNLATEVRAELMRMLDDKDMDEDIVLAMLKNKRILVVVDGLSERSAETRQHVVGIYGTAPINALVLTSRLEPEMHAVSIMRPHLAETANVLAFINGYANGLAWQSSAGHRELGDREQLAIAERTLAIAEQRGNKVPMTALLISLFVKNAIEQARRDGKFDLGKLVKSVPELIISYLERVNPQGEGTPNRVANEMMIPAVRALSRAALEPDFLPGELRAEHAEDVIDKKIGV